MVDQLHLGLLPLQTWETLATVDRSASSYSDTEVTAGNAYLYSVVAENDAGQNASVTSASVTPPSGDVSNAAASAPDVNGDFTISWGYDGADAAFFEIEMHHVGHGNFHTVATPAGTARSTNLTLPSEPGTFKYRMRVIRADGSASGYADVVSGAEFGSPPIAPQDVYVDAHLWTDASTMSVRWEDWTGDEEGYRLYYVGTDNTRVQIKEVGADETITNVTVPSSWQNATGDDYFYVEAVAYNSFGESAAIELGHVVGYLPGAIAAPTNMRTEDYTGGVTIRWDGDYGSTWQADPYRLEVSTDGTHWFNGGSARSNYVGITDEFGGGTTTYGGTIQYRVAKLDPLSGEISGYSNEVTVTFPEMPGVSLSAAEEATGIQLTWQHDGPAQVALQVKRPGRNWEMFDHPSGQGTSIIPTDGESGEYLFRAHAAWQSGWGHSDNWYNVEGWWATSDVTTASATATATAPPAAPDRLTASIEYGGYPYDDPEQNKVTLNWSNVPEDEEGYKVYRWDNPEDGWELIGTTEADEATYLDMSMLPNDYAYKVEAFNSAGTSGAATTTADVWPPGFLVSFDGTWDWEGRLNDDGTARVTGARHLFLNYRGTDDRYIRGVGNAGDYPLLGFESQLAHGAFGWDALRRVGSAYEAITRFYQDDHNRRNVPLDIVGYSRGAFQAVKLASVISEYGIPDLESTTASGKAHLLNLNYANPQLSDFQYFSEKPTVRFLGLLSPVGQMGGSPVLSLTSFSGLQLNIGWPTHVPPNVLHVAQFLHLGEGEAQQPFYPETEILTTTHESTHRTLIANLTHGGVGTSEQVARLVIETARQVNVPVEPLAL